ncbi:MAG: TonB-dependent receptor [Bacteroidetes bacterium]|nr:TonB-dependent receptor [Bacteroidota bacterium]
MFNRSLIMQKMKIKTKNSNQVSKMFISLCLMFLFAGNIFAQNKTITGVVKDQSGETIISATVMVKGTSIGTVTNFDGQYKLDVPANAKTLVVSYVGMQSQEIAITGNVINVTLKDDTKMLDDVVVIGYGTQRKKDLTGSVSSVSEKSLKDVPVATVAEALTGKLPGVQVTTTEGSPDAEIKIRVRGGGSITQSNSPLYIVDGFARDGIKDISPSEIKTIDVLKDASSTAIYGSRGANGVIIVTTKTGEQGKMSVTYAGYVGFKQITKTLSVLSPYQFARKQYERAVWSGTVSSDYEKYFGSYNDIELYNYMNGTDWQTETFGRTGFTSNHTFTLTGGSKAFKYNASYSRIDDKAIMAMSDYHRDNFSVKFNYQPIKWLKLDFSTRFAGTTINGSGANDQTGTEKSTSDSRVKNAVIFTPIKLTNLISQDDDIEASASLYSPLETTADNDRKQRNTDFNVNGGFSVNFTKDLSFRSTLSLTQTDKDDKRFYGLSTYYVREGGALKRDNQQAPAVLLTSSDITIFQNTNVLNYKKDNIFKGQNLSVVLGQETYNKAKSNTTTNIEAFPLDYDSHTAWNNLQDGTNRYGAKLFQDMDDRMISFFGRVNYDVFDKYLLAITFRADGSSKFSGDNQWGYFPSVSAGWRITEEKFMAATAGWLSNLKLRASYGESGNNGIDNSAFKRTYTSSNSNNLPPNMSSSIFTAGEVLANPDLKWETTITRGIGMDFGFFKDRINGSFELYTNKTEDVLIKMPISGVGYMYQWQNAATTANKGAELSLNAALISKKDFHLNFAFNISANKNNVINIGNLSSYTFNENWTSMSEGSNSYIVTPGQPIGLIYGFVTDGWYAADDFEWNGSKWIPNSAKYQYNSTDKVYYDADGNKFVDNATIAGNSWGPGAIKLKDTNKDGIISDLDRKVIGNTNPKHYGSFTFSGDYKGFDASVSFNWVYGNDIYNANKVEMSSLYYKHRNMLALTSNSYTQIDWATGNRITDTSLLTSMNAGANMWAAPTGRYVVTSWAIEDGSFLRLNNLTLGYTVPANFTKKFHIQKFRVYGTVYNLYTWTKYTGYDPEVDSRRATPATPGVDYSAYPKSRSYNLGVNLTF